MVEQWRKEDEKATSWQWTGQAGVVVVLVAHIFVDATPRRPEALTIVDTQNTLDSKLHNLKTRFKIPKRPAAHKPP